MKKQLELANLNRYIKPKNADFEKAMKNASSKYDKIKEAIKILLNNYEKDRHDFDIRTSQKVSNIFLKNNLSNIKEILSDDTTVEDFVNALNISLGDMTFAKPEDREKVRDYVLFQLKKILRNEARETKNSQSYVPVSILEDKKEEIKKGVIATNASLIAPKFKYLTNSLKAISILVASTLSSISVLNMKLKGTTLKLHLMKMKNAIVGTTSMILGGATNILKKGFVGIVETFKWTGKAIVSSLVAIGKGTAKLLGSILGFAGKLITGIVFGALSLVKNIFGLLFKGLMLVVGGIFFLFKMAIKAVTVALGIIGGIVLWVAKGVYNTISFIIGGVRDFLAAHGRLIKKVFKGIFAGLSLYFLTPRGAYFLGMIAGFTWKYIVLPIAKTIGKVFKTVIDAKDKFVKWITDVFSKDEENGTGEEEQNSIMKNVLDGLKQTDWYIAMSSYLDEILKFSENIAREISSSLLTAIDFIKDIPNLLVGHAVSMTAAGTGYYLGKIIGMYFGGPGLGLIFGPIGALIGGAIGYWFESRRREKFEKTVNYSQELERLGVQKNVMLVSSKHIPSERSIPRKHTASILTQNLMAGAKKEKSKDLPIEAEKIEKLFERLEKAKDKSLLAETRKAGEHFEEYKSNVQTPMTIKGTNLSIGDFSISESRKDLEEKIQKELEAASSGKDFSLKTEIDTLYKSTKDALVGRFISNKFIKERLEKWNWSLNADQFKTPEEASAALLDQIYSLYGFSAYLILVESLVTGYLTKNEMLDMDVWEVDPYSSVKWLLMFAKNNEVLTSISPKDFKDFYDRFVQQTEYDEFGNKLEKKLRPEYDVSHPSIEAIFSRGDQERRAKHISNYITQVLEGQMNESKMFEELNYLLGAHKTAQFMTATDYTSDKNNWLKKIINVFNNFFKEAGIVDLDIKAAIINQVFAKCLENIDLDFASAMSRIGENNLFSDILNAFSETNILKELSKFSSKIDLLKQTETNIRDWESAFSTGNLEKFKETTKENLESAFETVLAKILEDSTIEDDETSKLHDIMALFDKTDVNRIIEKLKQKFSEREGLTEEAINELFIVPVTLQSTDDPVEGISTANNPTNDG